MHSPVRWGIWWSHVGWSAPPSSPRPSSSMIPDEADGWGLGSGRFLCTAANAEPLWSAVPDLLRFPELVWMDRWGTESSGVGVGPERMGGGRQVPLRLSGGICSSALLGWGHASCWVGIRHQHCGLLACHVSASPTCCDCPLHGS